MIVFDVDGTLIGGESVDWTCFAAAFDDVAGFGLSEDFFASAGEITAQAIVHQALHHLPLEQRKRMERSICQGFLQRLKKAHEKDSVCFRATHGAAALINELQERQIPMAIATGDWRETISFKLGVSGLSLDGIPMVTSSEFYSRSEIIAAAVLKAGGSLDKSVYVGDGLWDLRACEKLGVRFVGVGCGEMKLRAAGARQVLRDLSPPEFWMALAAKPNHF